MFILMTTFLGIKLGYIVGYNDKLNVIEINNKLVEINVNILILLHSAKHTTDHKQIYRP